MDCSSKDTSNVTTKINKWVEKFAIWLVGILISVGSFLYTQMDTRIDKVEERVAYLSQDKVGRQELREEVTQIRVLIDRMSQEQMRMTESMKSEILDRLELILRFSPMTRSNNE